MGNRQRLIVTKWQRGVYFLRRTGHEPQIVLARSIGEILRHLKD